jgi:hypothetical protein
MTWYSVHVYYHDDQTPLIRHAIRPALAVVRTQVPRAYFVRHWRLGPHVRLDFDTDQLTYVTLIRPAVHELAGAFLAEHPSRARLDQRRLAPLHERLAAVEDERGPLGPWHPDNSIIDAEHDARLHVLGSAAAHDLLTDFYVATTELAFGMTEHAARHGDLQSQCLDLIIATAHAFAPLGIAQGAISMRSHAEWFLATSDTPRSRLDAAYRPLAARLRDRVGAVTRAVDQADGLPHVQDWLTATRPIYRQAGSLLAAGQLAMPSQGEQDEGASPFHQALAHNEVWLTQVRDAPWFMQYRLLLNYLYLQLTRLGVTASGRFLLCYLVACAVEERSG